jgi:hypothetical protein
MIITPLDLDMSAIGVGQSGSVRATGLHASDIYDDLYKHLEPKRFKGGTPAPLLLETGLILETALEDGLAKRFETAGGEDIKRPGEFTYEGPFDGYPVVIHYNPDLFIFNGCFRIGEIKATWLSSHIDHAWVDSPEARVLHKADIEAAFLNPKFDKYLTQLKMYCYMQHTTHGRLYVCFIAGDYTRPFKSQLVAVDLEFTQDELDQEWAMLMYHAIAQGLIT